MTKEEAAEEYAPDFSDSIASKAAVDAVRDAFKAGAEWMVSQGETAEVGYWNKRGLSLCLDKPLEKLGYKEGDKVIVQIRKK